MGTYTHQLLYSHPYLKDVIFPIGSTLAGTILAWLFMPRLLRRFHKYGMQSHDDFDVQGCNGRTNHYGITVPWTGLEGCIYSFICMVFALMEVECLYSYVGSSQWVLIGTSYWLLRTFYLLVYL